MESTITDLLERFPELTRRLLTGWESRGWIATSAAGARGRGRSRRYSEQETRKLQLMCRYRASGASWEAAHDRAEKDLSPRVLIVEGDPLCAELIKLSLGNLCRPQVASTAERAMRWLTAADKTSPECPQMIIVNLELALREGKPVDRQAGELVRKQAEAAGIRVLTTTAAQARSGSANILVKPYSLALLKDKVCQLLAAKEGRSDESR